MSNDYDAPKELTVLEYEGIRGRLAALEILSAQSWVAILKHCPDDQREELIVTLQIEIEKRFDRLHPIAQRVASESADNILSSTLATVRNAGA